ncbi:MAG: hypothetical protein AAF830_05785 [Pseudomonadota bacterium]
MISAGLSPSCASPWAREPGQRFNRSQVEAFASEAEDQRFAQVIFREYLELGLGDHLTFGGQFAGAMQESSGPGYAIDSTGTTEAELFILAHNERSGRTARAWRFSGGFPTAKFARGQRVMGQDSFLGIDRVVGYGGDRFFAVADGGGRISLGDDANQLRLSAKVGLKRGRAILLAESFNIVSVSEAQPTGTDFDLGQLSLSAVMPVTRTLQFEVGGRLDTYTRNINPGQAVFFSLWWTV